MTAEEYLVIPSRYIYPDMPLRWSESGDAVQIGERGSTFALGVEIIHFLEGFASQRPLIHFGLMLHLLTLLRPSRLPRRVKASVLSEAFSQPGRNIRNAGAFCALLCREVPTVVDPPSVEQLWDVLMRPGWPDGAGTREMPREAHDPPWFPEEFDSHVREALERYSEAEVLHWIREGCGSATRAAEKVAEEVLETRPRSLGGILAALAQHVRLRESVPFVGQLVSALTLPPRQLIQPELPLGGFSDVSTRGSVEHLLPSQLVFEGLEFVRRHAQNELLYFRREEPQQPTAEALVVLLDQGVRTWGIVRVVLTAALFALGQLAGRRQLSLRLAATSNAGRPCDPLEGSEADLEKLLAASDLSPHPGLALETVLEEPAAVRDVVLLTHPRSLAEPDVRAAARRAGPHTRLFAVTVNDRGEVGLQQLRHGSPVSLSRFRVDLEPAIPAAPIENTNPRRAWQGDVEPIGYPFQLGIAGGPSPLFAFDHAGDFLLLASGGLLFLHRADGSGYEILPNDLLMTRGRMTLCQVLGVVGGFVVVWRGEQQLVATHYDLGRRRARRHLFELSLMNQSRLDPPVKCYYLCKQDLLVVQERQLYDREYRHAVCLATGRRTCSREVCGNGPSASWLMPLPLQANGEPEDLDKDWSWPTIELDAERGALRLQGVVPSWEEFIPLADNKPVLRAGRLLRADCQGHTLAALVKESGRGKKRSLRLFRGPQGVPQAAIALGKDEERLFVLSSDGRLLAWQQLSGTIEVREVLVGGRVRGLTVPTRPVELGEIELHDHWLAIRTAQEGHLLRWSEGRLLWNRGKALQSILAGAGLPWSGEPGRQNQLPPFLADNVTKRFLLTARRPPLLAVSDRFGQVALLRDNGQLLCMVLAWQDKLAAWLPDGPCYGSHALLGCPETPGAAVKIAQALLGVSAGTRSTP